MKYIFYFVNEGMNEVILRFFYMASCMMDIGSEKDSTYLQKKEEQKHIVHNSESNFSRRWVTKKLSRFLAIHPNVDALFPYNIASN